MIGASLLDASSWFGGKRFEVQAAEDPHNAAVQLEQLSPPLHAFGTNQADFERVVVVH